MKREMGIARCGLACCLCAQNETCGGCDSEKCPGQSWCQNRSCSIEKGISHCYTCEENCQKGLLTKIKPQAFNLFLKRYGEEALLACLEANEKAGIVYHREGISGDYDEFEDVEKLIEFIKTGRRD